MTSRLVRPSPFHLTNRCISGTRIRGFIITRSMSFERENERPTTAVRASSESQMDKRIYVLGIGNLGKLFAHGLATVPKPPPITLLLHRSSLLQEWEASGKTIEIVRNGSPCSGGTYDVESIEEGKGTINQMIVATKAQHTVKALESIKHRFKPSSTLLFLQNGMGTIDEVDQKVFPEPLERPSYLVGITSHGVYSKGSFSSVLAGPGAVTIGPRSFDKPNPHESNLENSQSNLLHQVLQPEVLNAREVSSEEIILLQLEKLVMNAMINPLTVIFNCKNGVLFKPATTVEMMKSMLSEAVMVICSMPEICVGSEDGIKKVRARFSIERLEKMVLDIAQATATNTSSMLQDAQVGKLTEIDYINGYIVKRGKELGIPCPVNERVVQAVKDPKVLAICLKRVV